MNKTIAIALHGPCTDDPKVATAIIGDIMAHVCTTLKAKGLGPEPWLVTMDDNRVIVSILPIPALGSPFEGLTPGEDGPLLAPPERVRRVCDVVASFEVTKTVTVSLDELSGDSSSDGHNEEAVAAIRARRITQPVVEALLLNSDVTRLAEADDVTRTELRKLWIDVLAHDAELSEELREKVWLEADFSTQSVLQYLTFAHIPNPEVKKISMRFTNLAYNLCRLIHPSPERTKMLDEIRLGKDRAITAYLDRVSKRKTPNVLRPGTKVVREPGYAEVTLTSRDKMHEVGVVTEHHEHDETYPYRVRWKDGAEQPHRRKELVEVVAA